MFIFQHLEALVNGFIGGGTEIPGHFKSSIYLGKTETKPKTSSSLRTAHLTEPQVLAVLSAPHLETIFVKMVGDTKGYGQNTGRIYCGEDSTSRAPCCLQNMDIVLTS